MCRLGGVARTSRDATSTRAGPTQRGALLTLAVNCPGQLSVAAEKGCVLVCSSSDVHAQRRAAACQPQSRAAILEPTERDVIVYETVRDEIGTVSVEHGHGAR